MFLAGRHNFIETVIVHDADTRDRLGEWTWGPGKERRGATWFRGAAVVEAIDAV